MKHDYESALNAFAKTRGFLSDYIYDAELAAIEYAIRLVAKVTGDLSQEMSLAAMDRVKENEALFYEAIFKAMIAQAEKEIEQ